jgi:predicted DNA-binding ribbon-helix-helix protein
MKEERRTRAMKIHGRNTNLSLEPDFWQALGDIARDLGVSRVAIVAGIAERRSRPNLSSAVRVYVLEYYIARFRDNANRGDTVRADE